jgi:hypothetical protein
VNQERLVKTVRDLVVALRGLEWAGVVWGDEPCCLFCGALMALDLPETDAGPAQKAGVHRPGCEWVSLMEQQ